MESLIAILIGVLVMEGYAWLDAFAKWLLERAVKRINAEDQDRCREEWNADLNSMPNSVWKLMYALNNFSSSDATEINSDCCEKKWDAIVEKLDEITSEHQKCIETLRVAKAMHAESRTTRKLQRTVIESTSSLLSGDWRIGKPEETTKLFENAVASFENLGNTMAQASDRIANLTGASIDQLDSKLDQVDRLLRVASKKRDLIKEVLQHRNFSRDDTGLLTNLDNDLKAISCIIEADGNDHVAKEERDRIFAALEKAVASINSRLKS